MPLSPTSLSDCLVFTTTRRHFTADQLFGLLGAGFFTNQLVGLSVPSLSVMLGAHLLGWGLFGVQILHASIAS